MTVIVRFAQETWGLFGTCVVHVLEELAQLPDLEGGVTGTTYEVLAQVCEANAGDQVGVAFEGGLDSFFTDVEYNYAAWHGPCEDEVAAAGRDTGLDLAWGLETEVLDFTFDVKDFYFIAAWDYYKIRIC